MKGHEKYARNQCQIVRSCEQFSLRSLLEKCGKKSFDTEVFNQFAAESGESESQSKKKTKRMRTTFTEEQVQILQANFQIDSNPDGQDLERIAQITGLSKRVTQVWFQNCRARQKKYINSGKRGSGGNAGV